MPEPLTKRQKQILNHLTKTIQQEGYPPSIREIGASLGIKSPRGVAGHLEALQRKGYIERERGARTIKIKQGRFQMRNRRVPGDASESVPVLGTIAASSPLLANE